MISSFKKIALAHGLSLLGLTQAFAECSLNGEVVPCENMPFIFWLIPVFLLSLFIFWLWMFVDAIRFQKTNRVLWIISFLLFGGVTAILYYFLEKRSRHAQASL